MSALSEYLRADNIPSQPHLHALTVNAYHRMGELGILDATQRTELIEGAIFDMTPIGSEHADWVDRFNRFFSKTLPDEITVRIQNPVSLDNNNEPEPDIALLRPRTQPYREAHPRAEDVLLIIEIADSSLAYDRDVKVPLYAQHLIPEIWLLDVARNRLEIYRHPIQGEYRTQLRPLNNQTITLHGLEDMEVDLQLFFHSNGC